MSDYISRTIRLVGGPCDGQHAGVSKDQSEVHMSVGNGPWYHVYKVDQELLVGNYVGQRDVKLMRVG